MDKEGNTDPLHGIFAVSNVVEAHGDSGGCDARSGYLKQPVKSLRLDELYGQFLVAEEGTQVLESLE